MRGFCIIKFSQLQLAEAACVCVCDRQAKGEQQRERATTTMQKIRFVDVQRSSSSSNSKSLFGRSLARSSSRSAQGRFYTHNRRQHSKENLVLLLQLAPLQLSQRLLLCFKNFLWPPELTKVGCLEQALGANNFEGYLCSVCKL